jgi:hypothetical protein
MASGMPRPESNQRTRLRKPLTAVMPRRAPPEFKATEMRVTLHRCGTPRRFGPCRRVQKSLVEEGIPYEVAAEPWRPKKRTIVLEGTGQSLYQNTGSKPGGFKPSARRTHELGTGFCRQWRQRRMEPLWCPAVAIGGNQWQMDREAQPLKQAKTVAVGCDRLPESFHGKEGVDGSSPSEGFNSGVSASFRVIATSGRLFRATRSPGRPRRESNIRASRSTSDKMRLVW